ncbi:Dimeric alpha-beta barrel [Beauveria brongniartii RCEF 3172]|uniref:Dimeric alpha-beta barrel n=1 Tax=Beauveria brongniartii RCEF 3172 TaxID=1081107 RepID=A0A162J496_9HYPO|nr:Dimeric alpha-beta barrel [Beauveria brongniartii RCEF 3172]
MATCEVTQLSIVTFRPDLSPPYSPPAPPSAFLDVAAKLQAVPGARASYLGYQLEDSRKWVWVVRWATGAALDAFLASPSYARWLNSLRAVADTYASDRAFLRGSIAASLNSPCTEIVTACDADPGFVEDRLRPFSKCFEREPIPGYHALSYGQWLPVAYDGVAPPVGISAGMLIGWDSKDAHFAQRGEGMLIDRNIHHIRGGRKSLGLYHVNFTRL